MFAKTRRYFQLLKNLGPSIITALADQNYVQLENFFDQCDELKGFIVKLLQVEATIFHHAVENKNLIVRLQSNLSPYPFKDIKRTLDKALKPNTFTHFEQQAFAAASTGQVHKATYHDKTVAVKVQYPELKEFNKVDVSVVKSLAPYFLKQATGIDFKNTVTKMLDDFTQELDYGYECKQQEKFTKILEPFKNISIPHCYKELTSQKILVSDYVDGTLLSGFKTTDNASAQKIIESLLVAQWHPLIHHKVLYTDPHPGNFIITPDGALNIIDFGAVKSAPTHIAQDLVSAVLHGFSQEQVLHYVDSYDKNNRAEIVTIVNSFFDSYFEPYRDNRERLYWDNREEKLGQDAQIGLKLRHHKIFLKHDLVLILRWLQLFQTCVDSLNCPVNYHKIFQSLL